MTTPSMTIAKRSPKWSRQIVEGGSGGLVELQLYDRLSGLLVLAQRDGVDLGAIEERHRVAHGLGQRLIAQRPAGSSRGTGLNSSTPTAATRPRTGGARPRSRPRDRTR